MELPLIPAALIPGAYNRFAHAAAMNVVDDPGMICNPLMVFGEPGSGKTHFIHYIAYTLSSGFGLSAILVTDGIRFSRAIEQALADGTMDRLEAFLAGIKVLIIDDLHRLEVSAANKVHIARFLDGFIENNKQVILASGFPPDYIAGLEEAAGFQFTQGWIVDLKRPTPQQYRAILDQRIRELGLAITGEELTGLFFSGNTPSLTEAIKTLESMKKTDTR
jgi:chromosomal replication initiator protein